jgi:leucyl aminopeptidase (aminopeptidase T)
MGKDPQGISHPYKFEGRDYDSYFHLLLDGEKVCRSFWSPGVTIDSFVRTVPIDYALLRKRAAALCAVLDKASRVRVTAPGGTDVTLGVEGRKAFADDGDFSFPGAGGNLPAGECYISPEIATIEGRIVFDGSFTSNKKDDVIKTPIDVTLRGGYVTEVKGGDEARLIRETIEAAEENSMTMEKNGELPPAAGAVYKRNARAVGELGIGLNPAAKITGNMLEDEKAFHTCHFAIGANYDDDAPALIHLDCLVREPTIVAIMRDGSETPLLQNGALSV